MRIKIKKALKLVDLSPTQKEHILKNIPTVAVDRLTSKELAELIVAMHKHYHEGKHEAEKEIALHIGVPQGKTIWTVQL